MAGCVSVPLVCRLWLSRGPGLVAVPCVVLGPALLCLRSLLVSLLLRHLGSSAVTVFQHVCEGVRLGICEMKW